MEQGPVLEGLRYPLGVVKGIAGQTRLKVHQSSLYSCESNRSELKYDLFELHGILS